MDKLNEWINEYVGQLDAQYRKGVISRVEYLLALNFHKNIAAQYENFQVAWHDLNCETE